MGINLVFSIRQRKACDNITWINSMSLAELIWFLIYQNSVIAKQRYSKMPKALILTAALHRNQFVPKFTVTLPITSSTILPQFRMILRHLIWCFMAYITQMIINILLRFKFSFGNQDYDHPILHTAKKSPVNSKIVTHCIDVIVSELTVCFRCCCCCCCRQREHLSQQKTLHRFVHTNKTESEINHVRMQFHCEHKRVLTVFRSSVVFIACCCRFCCCLFLFYCKLSFKCDCKDDNNSGKMLCVSHLNFPLFSLQLQVIRIHVNYSMKQTWQALN